MMREKSSSPSSCISSSGHPLHPTGDAYFQAPPVGLWGRCSLATSVLASDRNYKQAPSQYESGIPAEAVALLEKLGRQAADILQVQELPGLVYAVQSQNAKANQHLGKAIHLKPYSSTARTNFANNPTISGTSENSIWPSSLRKLSYWCPPAKKTLVSQLLNA